MVLPAKKSHITVPGTSREKKLDLEGLKNQARQNALTNNHSFNTADAGRRIKSFAGSKIRDVRYQSYLMAVNKKLERIATNLFPTDHYGKKIYGRLTIRFSLSPDGNVHSFSVIRSSGNVLLDQGVQRIVNVAAPFSRFPADIIQETDLIWMTQTLVFLEENHAVIN
jgi:protein TonB